MKIVITESQFKKLINENDKQKEIFEKFVKVFQELIKKNKEITKNSTNKEIRIMQIVLRIVTSEKIELNGILDENTQSVVKKFQSENNLKSSGYFDLETIKKLSDKFFSIDKVVNPNPKKDEKSPNLSNVDTDWMTITKKVIDKFEGGYWNPKCKHPSSGMGKSTETMFGLDRYNGNIESTPEGREFFGIIDQEKKNLGNEGFCKKWKWLYRGGDKENVLKDLAAKIMKRAFDRNMSNFVKNPETKKTILGNKGLLLHMSYASWNGPGYFQKFARSLDQGVKKGLSIEELINLAIEDRSKTKLLNKNKVATAIKNPDL